MLFLLITLHVVVCFILIMVVLLQTGKGADLASAFGMSGSQTAFGPRGATSFLSRATTWAAVMFMITSLALYLLESRRAGSAIREPAAVAEPAAVPVPAPAGAPLPGDGTSGQEADSQSPGTEGPSNPQP